MNTRVTRGLARCSVSALLLALSAVPTAYALAATDMSACDKTGSQVRLQVRVSAIQSAKGNLTITVYPDDAKRFLAKGGKLARQRPPVVLPVTSACFALPDAGHYAVVVYHDANNDHKFNRTFVGLPAEGYGFSRNPKSLIGLPSFSEVRFAAQAGDNTLDIQLTY